MVRFPALIGGLGMMSAQMVGAGELAPGATISLSGTEYGDDTELGGFSQRDENLPFEIRNAGGEVFISGKAQDSVTMSDVTRNLIFNRRLRDLVAASGDARIVGISATHFAGVDVVADYRPDGSGTVNPASASRSAGNGDVVSFEFTGTGLTPPEDSRICYAKTHANGWGLGASITVSAVESTGGPVFSAVIENAARPYLLPTDRIFVQSVETVGSSQVRIKWLSITSAQYKIYSATDPAGPWTFVRDRFGGSNPRQDTFTISGGFAVNPTYFFRIEDVP